MHALALEFLLPHLKPGGKVLDVGSGTGYLCAAFLKILDPSTSSKVIGIEHIKELVDLSI